MWLVWVVVSFCLKEIDVCVSGENSVKINLLYKSNLRGSVTLKSLTRETECIFIVTVLNAF